MATKKDRSSNINVPNALTLLRAVAVPVFGWMLLAHAHEGSWRTATTIVFMVAILTDFVDGKIARKYNLVTNFGKIGDSIADKALTGMAFIIDSRRVAMVDDDHHPAARVGHHRHADEDAQV